MFSRSRKRTLALLSLIVVLFATLMPGMASHARTLQAADVVALGGVCVADSAPSDQPVPAKPAVAAGHCAYCTLGAPLVLAARFDTVLATLDAPAVTPPAHPNDALPRHAVAVHPLSPRAPPRAL